jgi:LacI family transcriptional regulator, galactose operon repressor
MSKTITVKDIAEKLNVSTSTVSRALNNSSLITNSVKQLIIKTADEMGYVKRHKSRPGSRAILNILLFLPFSEEAKYHLFYDPAKLIHGILAGFQGTRINIIVELNVGGSTTLNNRKIGDIDGIIFAFIDPPDAIVKIIDDRKIPMLILNRKYEKFNYITVDYDGSMDILFRLVHAEKKSVKPFYLGLQTKAAGNVNVYRKSAFLKSCKEYGITEYEIRDITTFEEITEELLTYILENKFNWIVGFNDIVAASILSVSSIAKKEVFHKIALTGFDNFPLRNVFPKQIDTIDLEVEELGENAGEWLYNSIIHRKEEPIQLELEPRYIAGNTIVNGLRSNTSI